MGFSRYDRGREPRGNRGWDDGRRMPNERDERGFFERAGDEVSSWFGDEEAQRRREMDSRRGMRDADSPRDYEGRYPESRARRTYMGSDDDTHFDRGISYRDEGSGRAYAERASERPYGNRFGPDRAFHEDRFDRGSSQREMSYPRETRPREMSQRDIGYVQSGAATGVHDPHYSEWRNRQISELDRDYDEYRRENQSRFESDFSNWRNTRQAKRQMLGTVREHMNVVGSDDQPLGTVDKVRRDRIILTKTDSPDGEHHSISCGMIDRVEGDRVILEKPAEEARRSWGSEVRDRALFEREDDGEPGAHILNRSFSGTY